MTQRQVISHPPQPYLPKNKPYLPTINNFINHMTNLDKLIDTVLLIQMVWQWSTPSTGLITSNNLLHHTRPDTNI